MKSRCSLGEEVRVGQNFGTTIKYLRHSVYEGKKFWKFTVQDSATLLVWCLMRAVDGRRHREKGSHSDPGAERKQRGSPLHLQPTLS